MSIKEINNNGKSKVISSKTGVLQAHKAGLSNKADSSAPSHNTRPIVNQGHARHANTGK